MQKKIKLSEKLMEKQGNIRVNLEMQVLDEGHWNERGVCIVWQRICWI